MMPFGIVDDGPVGVDHSLLQKQKGVTHAWPEFARECLGQCLHRDLGCDLTIIVTAHAIGDDHQQGFP